jgi:hypothetical protein
MEYIGQGEYGWINEGTLGNPVGMKTSGLENCLCIVMTNNDGAMMIHLDNCSSEVCLGELIIEFKPRQTYIYGNGSNFKETLQTIKQYRRFLLKSCTEARWIMTDEDPVTVGREGAEFCLQSGMPGRNFVTIERGAAGFCLQSGISDSPLSNDDEYRKMFRFSEVILFGGGKNLELRLRIEGLNRGRLPTSPELKRVLRGIFATPGLNRIEQFNRVIDEGFRRRHGLVIPPGNVERILEPLKRCWVLGMLLGCWR